MHKIMVYVAKIRLLIIKIQCSGDEVIYEGEELSTKEIQWLNLDMASTKMEDMLVETQYSLEEINLGTNKEPMIIYHCSHLSIDLEKELVKLLKEFKDCIAWDCDEMVRLSKKLVKHHLHIKPVYEP